jgi:hypothetical protein
MVLSAGTGRSCDTDQRLAGRTAVRKPPLEEAGAARPVGCVNAFTQLRVAIENRPEPLAAFPIRSVSPIGTALTVLSP